MEDNDSELSYEIKEEDQFGFLDEVIKTNSQTCPTVPPLAPCSEATASLSSAFTKRDKTVHPSHTPMLTSHSIKTEIPSFNEGLPHHQQNQQMIHQQNQVHCQQLPQGSFRMTSNNGQTGNNDVDIYRDLILKHFVQDISATCSKLYLPTNPAVWTVDHANRWIIEMCQQFQLRTPSCQLNLNGRSLLSLTQEDFLRKIPEGGDTIYAQLHLWRTAHESSQESESQSCGPVHHRSTDSVSSWNSPTTPTKMPEAYGSMDFYEKSSNDSMQNMNMYYGMQQNMQYPQQMSQIHHQQRQQQMNGGSPNSFLMCNQQTMPSPSDSEISSNASSCHQEEDDFSDAPYMGMSSNFMSQPQLCNQIPPDSGYNMPVHNSLSQAHMAAGNGIQNSSFNRNTGTVHLWHFIRELLDRPKEYSSCVRWVDREEGTFKIESSHHLARFWGQRKNRAQMNYDKLSRSLRQYYKKGIIQKPEKKQRLVYKFLPPYNM
ncbi:hypothetical protein FO519_000260 [Halicephalobus sp. NKZ332]|nr:hypothetical protein FO519_000260 [Halicephalobus sp. NKZ332]